MSYIAHPNRSIMLNTEDIHNIIKIAKMGTTELFNMILTENDLDELTEQEQMFRFLCLSNGERITLLQGILRN